MHAFETSADYI